MNIGMLLAHKRNFSMGGGGRGGGVTVSYIILRNTVSVRVGVLTNPLINRESWKVDWGGGGGTRSKNYYEGYFACLAHTPYKAILILICLQ